MHKTAFITTAAAAAGLVIGAGVVYLAMGTNYHDLQAPDVVRDIVDVPKMSATEAESHRKDRFAGIETIEDTLALPSDFVRTEALYVLAGRSNSGAVQDLIHQANRVADANDRNEALSILFKRLTELDPPSALAMARTDFFATNRNLEQQVWHAWARMDLDAALEATKAESDAAARYRAAQMLFTAYGFLGNEQTERIEEELGIGPSQRLRAQYIYQLANMSPEEAFEYVNQLAPGSERDESVNWLAHAISVRFPEHAEQYADLLDDPTNRNNYRVSIAGAVVQSDPRGTIDQLLDQRRTPENSTRLHSAVHALATQDIELTMAYFAEARNDRDRQMFGLAIARELVKQDAARAISWAKNNDRSQYLDIVSNVLDQVAENDPQLALEEAIGIGNRNQRHQVLGRVLSRIVRTDPEIAVTYLDRITDPRELNAVAGYAVTQWAQYDAEAAIRWLLNNDKLDSEQLMMQVGGHLIATDVDAAMRILPDIGQHAARTWRQQIVQTLATERSIAAAQNFIRQFEGENGYADLQTMLIAGVAQSDIYRARQLAEQLSDGPMRDRAYTQLITMHAHTDPQEAVNWLNSIGNDVRRSEAIRQLASEWHQWDPVEALRWVNGLPSGSTRDNTIVQLASNWSEATPSRQRLIDSIGNVEMRAQAQMAQISAVARIDWRKAETLLAVSSLNQAQRAQVEQYIQYIRSNAR